MGAAEDWHHLQHCVRRLSGRQAGCGLLAQLRLTLVDQAARCPLPATTRHPLPTQTAARATALLPLPAGPLHKHNVHIFVFSNTSAWAQQVRPRRQALAGREGGRAMELPAF